MTTSSNPPQPASAPTTLMSQIGRFVFRYRDYLTPVLAVLVLLTARPHPLFGSEAADHWMNLLGFLVALTGQAIRITVIGYAYIVRGGINKEIAAPRLVREGFYNHSRNPMYLGNFLLFIGIALIFNSPLVYFILPFCLAGLVSIVRAEEEFLRGRFGAEYAEYCRTVNRFIPNIGGLRVTLSRMSFDWRRVLRKEYGTTFAWTSAVVVFLAVEQLSWHGTDASTPALLRLGTIWLAILACYLFVRWLKKSHRIDSTG